MIEAKYWWLVLKRVWGFLDRGELIISLVGGAASATLAGVTPLPDWSLVPAFVGGLLAVLLLITPARIHQELQTDIEVLRTSIAPRVSVVADKPRWRTDGKGVYVQLRVRNDGYEPLARCYGKLVAVRRMTAAATAGWISPEHEPHFLWASHQTGGRQLIATIPPHSDLFLSIASTDMEQNPGLFWFAFIEPQAHPLYIVHDLKIEVGASTGQPVRRWYRIAGTGPLDMTLEELGESDDIVLP